jgi:hypothetical protein
LLGCNIPENVASNVTCRRNILAPPTSQTPTTHERIPFNLLNYAFGVTGVKARDYVIGSVIGMLPGTLMYVYLGSLITNVSELAAGRTSGGGMQQLFYFAGLAATVGVSIYVTRIARRALAEATEGVGESAPPWDVPST